jgi:hypothetical protein
VAGAHAAGRRHLAQRLFPATLVEQEVLERTAGLEGAEHPPACGATPRRAAPTCAVR